jgi:hypothetical protein
MNYFRRATIVVLSLFHDIFFWPDADDHIEISNIICASHHFPKCVGAIDGTHLGVAFKPELDGEEHFTHKQNYAIGSTLVCDDHKRIWYIIIGCQVQFMIKGCIKILYL